MFSLCSPAGWDNHKKISILYENLQSMKPDEDYSDIIIRPTVRKVAPKEAEMQAEDEQAFLGRLVQQMQSQQPPTVGIAGAVNGATTSPTPAVSGVNSPAAGTPIRGVPVQKPVDRRASSTLPNQVRNFIWFSFAHVLSTFFRAGWNRRNVRRRFGQFLQLSSQEVLDVFKSSKSASF